MQNPNREERIEHAMLNPPDLTNFHKLKENIFIIKSCTDMTYYQMEHGDNMETMFNLLCPDLVGDSKAPSVNQRSPTGSMERVNECLLTNDEQEIMTDICQQYKHIGICPIRDKLYIIIIINDTPIKK